MQWIAPSEKDTATDTLEKCLWDGADQFRANSGPILGPSFLRFAAARKKREGETPGEPKLRRRASGVDEPAAYHGERILYPRAEARFDYLLNRHGGNVSCYYDELHDVTGRFDWGNDWRLAVTLPLSR